jgi:hypothetical protein
MLLTNPASSQELDGNQNKISRATFGEEEDDEKKAEIEDTDTRFIQSMKSEKNANLKRKFFKNIQPEYLM